MKQLQLFVLQFMLGCIFGVCAEAQDSSRQVKLSTTLVRLQHVLLRLQTKQLIVMDTSRGSPSVSSVLEPPRTAGAADTVRTAVTAVRGRTPDTIKPSAARNRTPVGAAETQCVQQCARTTCKRQCGAIELASNNSDSCPIQLETGCYTFFKKVMPRDKAKEHCIKNGLQLVDLETKEEIKVVAKYIAKIGGNKEYTAYWTSGNSFAKRRSFVWEKNNQPLEKEFWHKGEPSDPKNMIQERCVNIGRSFKYFHRSTIALSDLPCSGVLPIGVICEQS